MHGEGSRNIAVYSSSTFGSAYSRFLPLVRLAEGMRDNLRFVNLGPQEVTVHLMFEFADGIWEDDVTVPALDHVQLPKLSDIDPSLAGRGSATVTIRPRTAYAKVIAYLSRVDDTTGDAIFVLGQ